MNPDVYECSSGIFTISISIQHAININYFGLMTFATVNQSPKYSASYRRILRERDGERERKWEKL